MQPPGLTPQPRAQRVADNTRGAHIQGSQTLQGGKGISSMGAIRVRVAWVVGGLWQGLWGVGCANSQVLVSTFSPGHTKRERKPHSPSAVCSFYFGKK